MRKLFWGGAAVTALALGGIVVVVGSQAAYHPESWAGQAVALALGLGGRAVAVPQAVHATVAAAHGPVACPSLGCNPGEPRIVACDSLSLTPLPPQEVPAVTASLCGRGPGPACLSGRIVIDEVSAVSLDGPAAAMPAVRDFVRGEPWPTGAEECHAAVMPRVQEYATAVALMPHVEDDEDAVAPAPGAAAAQPEPLPAPPARELLAPPSEATDDESHSQALPASGSEAGENCEAEPGQPAPVPHLDYPHGCPYPHGSSPCVPRTIKGREGHPGMEECEPVGAKAPSSKGRGVDTLEFRSSDRSLSSVDLRGPF